MIDRTTFQRISKRIEGYEQDMIRLQFALTAIPALAPENGGDGEMEKALFLAGILRDMRFPSGGGMRRARRTGLRRSQTEPRLPGSRAGTRIERCGS